MRDKIKPEVQRIIKALEYIHVHYKHKIKAKNIAKYVRLSPQHLCRVFKKAMGITLTEYINSLRLEEAEGLMKENKHYFKCIAYRVGLHPIYFWKLFKRKHGISPREYMKHPEK